MIYPKILRGYEFCFSMIPALGKMVLFRSKGDPIMNNSGLLNQDSVMLFKCRLGVECLNECCRDLNIFLTPYDIIRLKKGLVLDSSSFIKDYCISYFDGNRNFPVVKLKMTCDENKICPLASEKGCTVYRDRPLSCRLYPVNSEPSSNGAKRFSLIREPFCKGFEEKRKLTIKEYFEEQELGKYLQMVELFKSITTHAFFQDEKNVSPENLDLFYTICYDIDKFRGTFLSDSFLGKFPMDEKIKAKVKDDDVALFNFGVTWYKSMVLDR